MKECSKKKLQQRQQVRKTLIMAKLPQSLEEILKSLSAEEQRQYWSHFYQDLRTRNAHLKAGITWDPETEGTAVKYLLNLKTRKELATQKEGNKTEGKQPSATPTTPSLAGASNATLSTGGGSEGLMDNEDGYLSHPSPTSGCSSSWESRGRSGPKWTRSGNSDKQSTSVQSCKGLPGTGGRKGNRGVSKSSSGSVNKNTVMFVPVSIVSSREEGEVRRRDRGGGQISQIRDHVNSLAHTVACLSVAAATRAAPGPGTNSVKINIGMHRFARGEDNHRTRRGSSAGGSHENHSMLYSSLMLCCAYLLLLLTIVIIMYR